MGPKKKKIPHQALQSAYTRSQVCLAAKRAQGQPPAVPDNWDSRGSGRGCEIRAQKKEVRVKDGGEAGGSRKIKERGRHRPAPTWALQVERGHRLLEARPEGSRSPVWGQRYVLGGWAGEQRDEGERS